MTDCLCLCLQRSWPGDDGRFVTRMCVIIGLLAAETWVADLNFTVLGNMYGALMHYNRPLLLQLFGKAVVCAAAQSVLW